MRRRTTAPPGVSNRSQEPVAATVRADHVQLTRSVGDRAVTQHVHDEKVVRPERFHLRQHGLSDRPCPQRGGVVGGGEGVAETVERGSDRTGSIRREGQRPPPARW